MGATDMPIVIIKSKPATPREKQPQQQANETEAAVTAAGKTPPSPGIGKLVDKLA